MMGGKIYYVYVIVTIIDSSFAGFNDTSHLTAQACILARSVFSSSASLMGLSTII